MDAYERADRARARIIYHLALARGELTDPRSRRRMEEMRQLAAKEARQEAEGRKSTIAVRRYSRQELLQARRIVRQIYQLPFDESEHPRASAGQPNGGQFVDADHVDEAPRELVFPKDMRHLAPIKRKEFAGLPDRTTAELQAELHTYATGLLDASDDEHATYYQQWVDRLVQLLAARNFSDEGAPLHVKKRVWAAQKKFTQLLAAKHQLGAWLANSKRTIFKTSSQVGDAQQKLDAVKQRMQDQAYIGGSRIPIDNPIRLWSFEKKFAHAADLALSSGNLAPEIAAKLEAAITRENLARAGAMVAAMALLHMYPVAGLTADVVLLLSGGVEAGLLAHRLYLEINSIQDETDLHAAAQVLEQELTSKAAEELLGLLIKGAMKGGKTFHKNYRIEYAPEKVRAIGRGEMMFSPDIWNVVPLKVKKRVIKNQVEHNKMLTTQQKKLQDAIDNAPPDEKASIKGTILNQQGREYHELSQDTLSQIPGADHKINVSVGTGEGSELDNVLTKGGPRVFVESKLTIRELNQRTVNQLKNAAKEATERDKIILDVGRKPTDGEKKKLKKAVGDEVFERIEFVSSQTELFEKVSAALE